VSRTYWLALAALAYAASVAASATRIGPAFFVALVPVALALALGWHWGGEADEPARVIARRALRTAALGAGFVAFGLAAPFDPASRALVATGGGIASTAGVLAISAAPGMTGLLSSSARPGRVAAALLVALAWTVALAVPLARTITPERTLELDLVLDARLAALAALGSLGVLGAVAAQALAQRRLELGASDRLRAFLGLAATLFAAGVVGSALRLARTEVLLPATVTVAGVAAAAVCHSARPDRLGRVGAYVFSVALLAVLPAMAGAALVRLVPEHASEAALGGALTATLGALAAPRMAGRIAPRGEPWAEAFRAATASAMSPEPDEAIERALAELTILVPGRLRSPSLYRFDPESHIVVDQAGYSRIEPARVPLSLAALACEEPHGVLRREVLAVAAVRRPDVKGALDWLDDRSIGVVALMGNMDSPIGLLAIPKGDREDALRLSEVEALRVLADRLGAAIAAGAALARSLGREAELRRAGVDLETKAEQLGADLEREQKRSLALAATLAARATRLAVSPAARVTLDAIRRLATRGVPLALLVPPGVDPLPWVAVFHLASEKTGTLFVADGRQRELADLELWRDPSRSPMTLARGGTLVVLWPEELPRLVQAYIGAAFDERVGLALVLTKTPSTLVASERMDERLADAVGDRAVVVPPLADRSEDLRPTAIDVLTRVGMLVHNRPLGIEAAALAALAEHAFPANDLELEALLVRAATEARGEVVTRADLAAAGFAPRRPAGE